ncbi:Z-ring formation inhibitor MciZ [Alkalihalobacillus hemicellulosilyticus]|uniref:Z-ring formation inhibitor MciZ n=1 Tax=Halalkalibacter hemicellulosilyticus TaxID=127886 RepID=UPI0022874B8B|nr:Z-ring formation inhibitor MciZ [Halalkalibacter hemicellulosilyticus]
MYIHNKGLTITGKVWEVRAKLKQLQHSFETVEHYINSRYDSKPNLKASATAQKKWGSSAKVLPID